MRLRGVKCNVTSTEYQMGDLKHSILWDLSLSPGLLTSWQCDFMGKKRFKHLMLPSIKWRYQSYISLTTSSTLFTFYHPWNREVFQLMASCHCSEPGSFCDSGLSAYTQTWFLLSWLDNYKPLLIQSTNNWRIK